MKKAFPFLSITVLCLSNLCIGSQLFFFPTTGSIYNDTYNGTSWENVTANINDAFDSVTVLYDLSDLNALLAHDALWINHQLSYQSLSDIEKQNIMAFIDTGRKVLMVGENEYWAEWNNTILSCVGATYTDGYSWGVTEPVVRNELTYGVSSVHIGGGGLVASGDGVPLFDQNFATLWGDNVLTILDINVFQDADEHPAWWLDYDTERFVENSIEWLAQPIPEPATLTLLALGGLALRKRK